MWTNRQFWRDATWRAFRTFCQTLAAVLAGVFSGFLAPQGTAPILPISGIGLHTTFQMWVACLYTAGVAGFISLLQSIDRERAVSHEVGTGQQPEPAATALRPAPEVGGHPGSHLPADGQTEVIPLDPGKQ